MSSLGNGTRRNISKRVSRACDCCRKSKTKCDGKRPCTRCLSDNKICTYVTSKTQKGKKLYSSQYVDLLETRVSILVQSLERVIELSETDGALARLLKEPGMYNDNGDVLVNKIVCRLMSFEKLQNLSKSGSINQMINISSDINNISSSSQNSSPIMEESPLGTEQEYIKPEPLNTTTPILSSSSSPPNEDLSFPFESPSFLNTTTPFEHPELLSVSSSSSSSFSSESSSSSNIIIHPQILFNHDGYSNYDNTFLGKTEINMNNNGEVLEWPEGEPRFELYH